MSDYEKKIEVLDKGFVQYIDHMGDDAAVPQAARVSYSKGTKTVREDADLMRFLMRHEHYSPFAMCQIKLYVRLPIFVHNQWVRHDRFHWNVMSGRYSEMPDDQWRPEPTELRAQGAGNKQVGDGTMDADNADKASQLIGGGFNEMEGDYHHLLAMGVSREQARCILPLAQYTECFVTATLGDWMMFLRARLDSHAQQEIRVYAEAVLEILSDLFPVAMQAFKDYQLNSVRFSAQEMAVLHNMLYRKVQREPAVVYCLGSKQPAWGYRLDECSEWFEKMIPNKRERAEFLAKINK